MSTSSKPPLILLLGVTASAKSAVAIELAQWFNAEIVSVDSMQVYRRMNIGTAKPTAQELSAVRHHLVDVVDPHESFSAARFTEMADEAIAGIAARGKTPLVVAGTPLYLMSLMYGLFDGPSADSGLREEFRRRAGEHGIGALHSDLTRVDPEAAARIHPNDYKRIERALEVHAVTGRPLSEQQVQWSAGALRYRAVVVGIRREKEEASRRINSRVRGMIETGLVEEVRSLLSEPPGLSEQARQAVGYAEIIAYLAGAMSLEDAVERIKINTRRLAKHQRTWFRKFPMTEWVDAAGDDTGAIANQIAEVIDVLNVREAIGIAPRS
ncbi:MAG: tRNA (adenosine(37)-N6)-dimethylallyltransferase MiaA [Phycisphaerae bacterium]|nr:tRNA (adenosine(37)-N6)-dimethylallyltransferase MiaA [Phycisphaerae bacterium]